MLSFILLRFYEPFFITFQCKNMLLFLDNNNYSNPCHLFQFYGSFSVHHLSYKYKILNKLFQYRLINDDTNAMSSIGCQIQSPQNRVCYLVITKITIREYMGPLPSRYSPHIKTYLRRQSPRNPLAFSRLLSSISFQPSPSPS